MDLNEFMAQQTTHLINKYFQSIYQMIEIRYKNINKSFYPQHYHAMGKKSSHKEVTIEV